MHSVHDGQERLEDVTLQFESKPVTFQRSSREGVEGVYLTVWYPRDAGPGRAGRDQLATMRLIKNFSKKYDILFADDVKYSDSWKEGFVAHETIITQREIDLITFVLVNASTLIEGRTMKVPMPLPRPPPGRNASPMPPSFPPSGLSISPNKRRTVNRTLEPRRTVNLAPVGHASRLALGAPLRAGSRPPELQGGGRKKKTFFVPLDALV